jgi:hypothetical protein
MKKAHKAYKNTVLVALLNRKADLDLLRISLWYRIPVDKAPDALVRGQIRTIAWYQTSAFGRNGQCIRYYGRVTAIAQASRRELFPDEAEGPQSEKLYYQVKVEEVELLPEPINVGIARRILFIVTTPFQFYNAKTVDDLFGNNQTDELVHWDHPEVDNLAAEQRIDLILPD